MNPPLLQAQGLVKHFPVRRGVRSPTSKITLQNKRDTLKMQ
jgi:hypothetical protein